MRKFWLMRCAAAALWPAILSCSAALAAPPANRAPAAESQRAADDDAATGFSCAAVSDINKISVNAYGVRIDSVRARAIPGIAGGFNLFELSYKVQNGNARKIWVSGEFVFGAGGSLTGAVSAASGLSGILPNETEMIKSTVLANDIFFKTENICFRFNVEQQKP